MPVYDGWSLSAAPAGLRQDQIQVWRIRLDIEQPLAESLFEVLSEDERIRANRFYFPHLRTRYIAARSALRHLAGELAGRLPQKLMFAYAQHGKPFLPDSPLRFNLAHTENLALIAFARERELGVDLEFNRPFDDLERIAQRFFSQSETAELLALPPDQRQAAFYACWTRKEAYIKAIGDGLSFPLDQFRVSLLPGAPPRLLEVLPAPAEAKRWKMIAVDPGPGYTGAVLAEGQDWQPVFLDFEWARTALRADKAN